jgi:hypothetical protein
MKTKSLLLASAWTFVLASAANAGQPLALSDAQMDRVVAAGGIAAATGQAGALGNLDAQTLTLALSSADQSSALAFGLASAAASSSVVPAAATSKSSTIARAP